MSVVVPVCIMQSVISTDRYKCETYQSENKEIQPCSEGIGEVHNEEMKQS